MVLSQNRRAAAIFSSRQNAEQALSELTRAGFSSSQISIVAKESDINYLDGYGTSDLFRYQAPPAGKATSATVTGSMVGAICGCLIGLGLITLPGFIPVVIAVGTSEAALAATLAGVGIGAAGGGLIEALVNSGISLNQAKSYSDRVFQGDFLVIVNGTEEEVSRAEELLSKL